MRADSANAIKYYSYFPPIANYPSTQPFRTDLNKKADPGIICPSSSGNFTLVL
jgi:hypothetical protein